MTLADLDLWLPRLYYVAQILLLLVAIGAARFALAQYTSFRLFELIKFLESEEFRDARRIVVLDIGKREIDDHWWVDKELNRAASTVCAFYDILGLMMQFTGHDRVHKFFVRHWANSIVNNYDAVATYIHYRRETDPKSYTGFETLYRRAKRHYRRSAS